MKVISSLLFCSSFITPYIPHFTYSTFNVLKPYPSVNINNFTKELANLKNISIEPIRNESIIIAQAIKQLGNVPGFWPTLTTYLKDSNKGTFFEIETALRIKNIIAMNIYCRHEKLCRQFDIVAHKQNSDGKIFGECKNINWENADLYVETREKLKQQFLDQQKLVDIVNQFDKSKNNYQVFSKTPLDSKWKAWFDKHAIKYYET
jgi:hypothetical protein